MIPVFQEVTVLVFINYNNISRGVEQYGHYCLVCVKNILTRFKLNLDFDSRKINMLV